jgi:hypothetical protein
MFVQQKQGWELILELIKPIRCDQRLITALDVLKKDKIKFEV